MSLIEMHDIRAHGSRALKHHPVDFADVWARQVALLQAARQIRRDMGVGIEEFDLNPEIAQTPEARQAHRISPKAERTSRTDFDFISAGRRHRFSERKIPFKMYEYRAIRLSREWNRISASAH